MIGEGGREGRNDGRGDDGRREGKNCIKSFLDKEIDIRSTDFATR